MNIQMIGIDHSGASVEYREIFSFTKTRRAEAMQTICGQEGVNGCVVLSTCNRMEVYVSTDGRAIDLYGVLCQLKQVEPDEFRGLFTVRTGMDAVRHLFSMSAGMESLILGEDQILMQVREALTDARGCDCTDKVLEVLFRMAVTAGKRVKTDITFHKGNTTAIDHAIERMTEQGFCFAGTKCLVIGNGEMGRLTALALKAQGADVTVTVRQYRSGIVQIPEGCHRIHYGERYDLLPECALVVSATASPNLTITRAELERIGGDIPRVFVDLAVPRDIDPEIARLPGVQLYDIDSFAVSRLSEETGQQIEQAQAMLDENIEEFVSWYECRDFVPRIQRISRAAAQDAVWRMGRAFDSNHVDETLRAAIEQAAEQAAAKVTAKLMFAVRDAADAKTLRSCIEAFETAYPEDKE